MINALIFLSVGILLIVAEMLVMGFFLIFFGIGFVVVGLLDFAFEIDILWQILLAFVISFVLLFALRKPIKRAFHKDNGIKDEFLDDEGEGEIKEGMVYFKGTLWKADISELGEGDKVEVLGIKNGEILIKK